MLDIRPLELDGVYEIRPPIHRDDRGFFSEVWSGARLAENGLALEFVQDNMSLSRETGTLRGLHYQRPPYAQAKLVRVTRGAILDVAVDIRSDSPTRGKWIANEISAEKWNQMLVPEGFAHGFLTLEPDTEVVYKVTAPYAPDHQGVIRYGDPEIGIEWPDLGRPYTLSDKDRDAPALRDADTGT